MEYNPNNKQKIALISIWVFIIIALLEIYLSENFSSKISILMPITLSAALFSLGYAATGTVKGGLVASVWFLSLMIIAVSATLISTNPLVLFPLILIMIGVSIFYLPILKAIIKKQENNQSNTKFNPKILILLFLVVAAQPLFKLLEIIIKKISETIFK